MGRAPDYPVSSEIHRLAPCAAPLLPWAEFFLGDAFDLRRLYRTAVPNRALPSSLPGVLSCIVGPEALANIGPLHLVPNPWVEGVWKAVPVSHPYGGVALVRP